MSETREGFLDLNDLERSLIKVRSEGVTQMIGCFSAASCITGVLADDVATTLLLHQYGALSVWDYTTTGNNDARGSRYTRGNNERFIVTCLHPFLTKVYYHDRSILIDRARVLSVA